MKRFVPREKLGKKARRALDRARRAEWAFPPVTRRVESKKAYNRKRKTDDRREEARALVFCWEQAATAGNNGRATPWENRRF